MNLPARASTIKFKIRLALSTVALLVGATLLMVYFSLLGIQEFSRQNSEVILPKVGAANSLKQAVSTKMEYLGYYLISKSETDLNRYTETKSNLKGALDKISILILSDEESENSKLMESISSLLQQLDGYEGQLLHFSSDIANNQGAMRLLQDEIVPQETSLIQLSGLLASKDLLELEGEGFEGDELSRFPGQLAQLSMALRTYLAFRNDKTFQDVLLFRSSVRGLYSDIESLQDELNDEQRV